MPPETRPTDFWWFFRWIGVVQDLGEGGEVNPGPDEWNGFPDPNG